MANILVVDDEPKMTSLVCGELEDAGHTVTTSTRPKEALDLIARHSYDVVITDLSMPDISGMQILEAVMEKAGAEVIIMTAYGSIESAVTAMKKGATDYLLKPFSLEELRMQVDQIVSRQKEKSLGEHFRKEHEQSSYGDFVGAAPATERVKQLLVKVAPTDSTVLITGRSGTGKELAARMVHDRSPRARQPFIAVNCAALTETLLESELFGHEKGAFTGAVARKRGRFELADSGTIFLDEIGELSPSIQSKLLRVLEEKKLIRVGGVDLINIDVRIVAATNRNLKQEVRDGRFREDLFFRLNVFPVEMPSLSERREDIIGLAEYFLKKQGYRFPILSDEVRELLLAYDWPGNIRELRNVMERAAILAGGEEIAIEDFSLEIDDEPLVTGEIAAPAPATGQGLESTEKKMILDALARANGNKTEAARLLKITRRRLYSRMKVHGIQP